MQFDRLRVILAATMGLGLAAAAFAQEAPAPAATPEAAPETAPATPATEAPATPSATAAEPGAAAPTDGNPAAPEVTEFVRDTFGDWQVRCFTQTDECFMYQLAVDTGKNPVAEVSVLKLPAGGEAAAGMTVVSPLGTLLTSGVVVQVDTDEARQYPFNWCSQAGCFSRFGLTGQSITSMKRGKAGKMTLISVAAPQNPISLNLSLTGFTDAFDSLKTPPGRTAPPAPAPTLAPKTLPSLAPRN
ncbi:invasion associated locus B family protein [uncultured Amaricoccus sp.]|uniref:invasion associated locus B family protein n=2 Tax=Amaricoccus TaxID=56999 RepID=UPI002613515C|nr:invasion associated locus B family protein [uncultured Amaricoccus sp.]